MEQSNIDFVESFDRKFEGFDRKDSKLDQADIRVAERFDTKNSEMKQSDNIVIESFDRKLETREEEALPDSESFCTEDSNVSIPNIDNGANLDKNEQSITLPNCACSGSENSTKADGRCKPRSQKQIEAYQRNFNARKSLESRIDELDSRLRHLQSLVLSLLTL